MIATDWQIIHQQLLECDWFSNVGSWTSADENPFVHRINGWKEAVKSAESKLSWWCVNEASNILSMKLHTDHNQEYQLWNKYIESFNPSIENLLNRNITPKVPEGIPTIAITNWIRSHLTRIYLEVTYFPLSQISLMYDQLHWYLEGRFPCGWYVKAEADFPEKSKVVVF